MNPKTKKQTLKVLGENLRAARRHLGITQETLAEKVGISVAYASLIERGGRNPPATTIIELAKAVGVQPGTLLNTAA